MGISMSSKLFQVISVSGLQSQRHLFTDQSPLNQLQLATHTSEFSTLFCISLYKIALACHDLITHHHIIIGFLINVQVQRHHPHQWAPFQVTG